MCRYDADVARLQLDDLHLPWRPAWESKYLLAQASQSERVIRSLEYR
jgi:hypothetical protein